MKGAVRKKYAIVNYELEKGRICITRCPYQETPKPLVGSVACMSCPSFHGRNREARQVVCSAVNGKTWKNRNKDNDKL